MRRAAAALAAVQRDLARLAAAMTRGGFRPYDKEWWHFTLANEPFPHTYFDFPVGGDADAALSAG